MGGVEYLVWVVAASVVQIDHRFKMIVICFCDGENHSSDGFLRVGPGIVGHWKMWSLGPWTRALSGNFLVVEGGFDL